MSDHKTPRQVFDSEPAELNFDSRPFTGLCDYGKTDSGTHKVRSLGELCSDVCKNGTATESLSCMPDGEFYVRQCSRPSCCAAQTFLHFGGLAMPTRLDGCVTCSVIPEEIIRVLIHYCFKC